MDNVLLLHSSYRTARIQPSNPRYLTLVLETVSESSPCSPDRVVPILWLLSNVADVVNMSFTVSWCVRFLPSVIILFTAPSHSPYSPQHYHLHRKAWLSFSSQIEEIPHSPKLRTLLNSSDLYRFVTEFM
jgi:hypothetical protein